MSLFRRLRDVPLRMPPPDALELPEQAAAHKCPREIRRATDSGLRRVADVELSPPVVEWIEDLAMVLAPFVEDGDGRPTVVDEADVVAAARELQRPLQVCAWLGTAFAELEVALRPIDDDKSDAVILAALGYSSFLQTRFGPQHLGFDMWRTARAGYYLSRMDGRADATALLPTADEISIVFNEVAPRYESTTQAMQFAWDTLIESHPATH